jgi:hypothetical protein
MSEKNYGRSMQFSVDLYTLIRQAMNDPSVKADIIRALKDGPAAKLTDKLGSCNFGTRENQVWASLFAATDKDRKAGDVGLYKRAEKSGFILLRLREQQKSMDATTGVPSTVGTDLQQAIEAASGRAVARRLPEPVAAAPAAPTASSVLDADVQAILEANSTF